MKFLLLFISFLLVISIFANKYDEFFPLHPLSKELNNHLLMCRDNNTYCNKNVDAIILLAAKLSNEHAALLLLDRAQSFFMEAFYFVSPDSPLGNKLSHMISIVAFAQGDITEV